MTRDQLIDLCAAAAYEDWAAAENQRRREELALRHAGLTPSIRAIAARVTPYEALDSVARSVWRSRARPMVIALERENALKSGGELVWDVEVDDPDMLTSHHYPMIVAWSAWAAAYEGARRAVYDDPTHGMPGGWRAAPDTFEFPVYLPLATDVPLPFPPALIEAVALHAKVWPAGARDRGDRPILIDPNDPWNEICS